MSREPSPSTPIQTTENSNLYFPLDKAKQSIRLLSIDAESEDIIRCQLHTVQNLKGCQTFIAVSYTWGAEEPTKAILLNGIEVKIRMNLYELLQQLLQDKTGQGSKYVCSHNPPGRARNYEERQESRQSMQYPDRWEYFWIDALCINQASVEEKSEQVAMMKDIFWSAKFVLAWLGPEADDSAFAMRVLDDMQIHGYSLLRLKEDGQELCLQAVCKLFRRPYWTRLCVVQEFVRAREVLLRSGDAGATVGNLSYYPDNSLSSIFEDVELRNFLSFMGMVDSRHVYKVKEVPILTDVILDFAELECSDIRDKVFALVSLSSLIKYPAPNYSATKEQVFLGILEEEIRWIAQSNYYYEETFESW